MKSLLAKLSEFIKNQDLKALAADIKPFIAEKKRLLAVETFDRWLEQMKKQDV